MATCAVEDGTLMDRVGQRDMKKRLENQKT